MRIVVDTNVLISGMFWGEGPPNQIIQAWLSGRVTVIASREILDEYRGVTARISAKKQLDVTKLLERLLMLVQFILPADLSAPVCKDSDDNKFIAPAFSGRAKYLVTGDQALLQVKRFRQTKIISPSLFCRISRLP